jgi:hypothetical protein
MIANNLTLKRGKFFPRGCRGFITSVEIYCDNPGSASRTFTIKISPMPGMGAVITATLSVAGGSSAAWRAVWLKKFWNYDSMFIWVSSDDDTYGRLGCDAGAPYDYYESTDEVSWSTLQYRMWFRVNFTGETVGDLPVSGTVNTIEVPSTSTKADSGTKSISAYGNVTLIDFQGAGECVLIGVWSDGKFVYPQIECDGAVALNTLASYYLQPDALNTRVLPVALGPGVALTKFDTTGNNYAIVISVPIKFRRRFTLRAYNTEGTARNVAASAVFNVIS